MLRSIGLGFLLAAITQAISTGVKQANSPMGIEQILQNLSISVAKLAMDQQVVKDFVPANYAGPGGLGPGR